MPRLVLSRSAAASSAAAARTVASACASTSVCARARRSGRVGDAGGHGREGAAGGVDRCPRRRRLRLEAGERLAGGDELGGESVALGFGGGIRLDQVFVLGGEAVTRGGGLLRRRDRGLGGDVGGLERGDALSAGTRCGIGVRGTRRAGGLGGRALALGRALLAPLGGGEVVVGDGLVGQCGRERGARAIRTPRTPRRRRGRRRARPRGPPAGVAAAP